MRYKQVELFITKVTYSFFKRPIAVLCPVKMNSKKKSGSAKFNLWLGCAGSVVMLCVILACTAYGLQYRAMNTGIQGVLRLANEYQQQASVTLKRINEMDTKDCTLGLPTLISMATLTSYTRSAGIISGNTITCSSFSRNTPWPVNKVFPALKVSHGHISEVTSSSSMHPNYGDYVIVYTRVIEGGVYAYTVLDVRNMQRLVEIIASKNHLRYVLQAGKGQVISFSKAVTEDEAITSLRIEAGGVSVTAYSTTNSLLYYLAEAVPIILPAFLFIILLSGIFWKRWHTSRISPASIMYRAMEDGEFFVCYQPVCDTLGRCRGAEALIRWRRADGRLISPEVFIPTAESEKIIATLTRHLMGLIVNDFKHWIPVSEFHLSINIAPEHICHDDFIEEITSFRDRLPPSLSLVTEVTERTLLENTQKIITHLYQLRKSGIKVAIDDFGTGYCSLSILQILPADYLKIDRCFTETIDNADGDTPVLDAIIFLSKRLKLTMIAEGISTEKQAVFMKNHQVLMLQGYMFSPPLNASDFRKWYLNNVNDTALTRKN